MQPRLPLRLRCWTAAVLLPALLGGCASVPLGSTGDEADAAGRIVSAPMEIEGREYTAHWYLPRNGASALIVLQHGFSRRCGHLRETTLQLMAAGLMALCIDASMAAGNPALADALARRLAGDLRTPDGHTLPARIIVAGHSAGAVFALRLGAQLAEQQPQRLAGALLFDPVATADFEASLRSVSDHGRRPVLAIFANAHGCNAQLNAVPALRRVRHEALAAGGDSAVAVLLTEGSTHVDAEGEDSDWIGRAACGEPLAANTALLRAMALRWVRAITLGAAPGLPEGSGWRPIE